MNAYISVPKDKGSLNCASFTAGIVEAVLTNSGFVSISVENEICSVQYLLNQLLFSFLAL